MFEKEEKVVDWKALPEKQVEPINWQSLHSEEKELSTYTRGNQKKLPKEGEAKFSETLLITYLTNILNIVQFKNNFRGKDVGHRFKFCITKVLKHLQETNFPLAHNKLLGIFQVLQKSVNSDKKTLISQKKITVTESTQDTFPIEERYSSLRKLIRDLNKKAIQQVTPKAARSTVPMEADDDSDESTEEHISRSQP